ncbi:MAG: hypothetical protein Q8876_02180 [Bacillota bacterium]|nr:hypothetical protein [Bacillota bacterium]
MSIKKYFYMVKRTPKQRCLILTAIIACMAIIFAGCQTIGSGQSSNVSSAQSGSSSVSKTATQPPTLSTASGSGYVANGTAVKKGQKVQYTLYLQAGPKNVVGMQAYVLYNCDVLKYSASSFPILTGAVNENAQNGKQGEFNFNCSNIKGFSFVSGGAAVVLTFDVIADGTISISPDIQECYCDNGSSSDLSGNWGDFVIDNKIVASGVKAENQIKIIG